MRLALLSVLPFVLAAAPCSGQGIDTYLTAASRHYVSGEYNETNPGFLLVVGRGWQGVAGLYTNSYAVGSVVGGIGRTWRIGSWTRAVVALGLATGYSGVGGEAPFGAVPTTVQIVAVGPPGVKVALYHVPGAIGLGMMIGDR